MSEFPLENPPQSHDENSPDVDNDAEHKRWASEPNSPGDRIAYLRDKIEKLGNEFSAKRISQAQYNAIYSHYVEQRQLIEKIIAKNPDSDGWKQAARSGKTSFLRDHYDAQPVNYVVYLHRRRQPLMGGGTRPDLKKINGLLRALWSQDKVRVGVAKVSLNDVMWLVMAAGRYGVTFVTYQLEPSGSKTEYVRDLHDDFERANRLFLQRGKINKAQMVFPQRALIERSE